MFKPWWVVGYKFIAQAIIFKTENVFRDLTASINKNKVDVDTILFRSLSHPDIIQGVSKKR